MRVNGVLLQANFQGLIKKPGTAPPADLGQAVSMTGLNRIEMVYSNSGAEKKVSYFFTMYTGRAIDGDRNFI